MRYKLSLLSLVAVIGAVLLLPGQAQAQKWCYDQGWYGYSQPPFYLKHYHYHYWPKYRWPYGHRGWYIPPCVPVSIHWPAYRYPAWPVY